MNKARRAQISDLISSLEALLTDAETIWNEEQISFDNLPENFQQGEKGQAAEEAANNLSEARDSIQSAIDSLLSVE